MLEGLQKQSGLSETAAAARLHEARLRKGYREILQDKLRPVLYRRGEDPESMKKLRKAYADALAADPEKSRLFDHLKYIRYTDFKRFGRLPRSSDGLVRSFESAEESGGGENDLDVIIFFSYRWVNQDRSLNTPDDAEHTQYRRMLDAAGSFLQQNPTVDAEKLCIWMVSLSCPYQLKSALAANTGRFEQQDFACVDQDNPDAGVSALPIIITQCDVVISLVDDMYYQRAWCCVEAMMVAELDRSYLSRSIHRWYEHMPAAAASPEQTDEANDVRGWTLQPARGVQLDMRDKKLTYEHDRAKVMFLERQSRLLGRL